MCLRTFQVMYCNYQNREELEDELYQEEEDDSEGSEFNSEVEFHLYSQLHYSSNNRVINEDDLEKKRGGDEGENNGTIETEQNTPLYSKDGLQQHHKECPERKHVLGNGDNHRTVQGNPKVSKSCLEILKEVIVIESGTDATSLSEDDTQDGICTLKLQRSERHTLQSSTPAQQKSQKRKRSPSPDSVVILDSGSEPEESQSESSSESGSDLNADVLENWMILGQGKQVEDHSISLNLEGEPENDTDHDEDGNSNWLVSSKDKAAQIYNKDKGARVRPLARRDSNRYYHDKNVTCRNCNKTGHLSKNCPTPKKVSSCILCGIPGHMGSVCPNRHCNNCGLPGHLYGSCNEKAYWMKQCHRCGMTGHFFDVCPEIWRQYHITTSAGPPKKRKGVDSGQSPAYCYNCSRKGHFGHACTQRRMFNGAYPTTPFIIYYDSPHDINQRDHRIKRRVTDLQGAGLFPIIPESPVTLGPPKKKQKTNYRHSYQQENAKIHQTPKVHKPSPSQVRFRNAEEQQQAEKPRRPAVIFKTKMADKRKQQTVSTPAKEWKPKREVPVNRGPRPLGKPVKHVFTNEEDFPRGGGKNERTSKKKKNKKNNNVPHRSPFTQETYTPEQLFGSGVGWKAKGKKVRARGRDRKSAKGTGADIYPTDENLFTIKQRKRKR